MGETKAMVYCNASEEVVDVINDDQFEFVVPAPDRGPGQAAAGTHVSGSDPAWISAPSQFWLRRH